MSILQFKREKKIYNDANIQYQIKYFFGNVKNVEFSDDEVVITAPDDTYIDSDIINEIIKGNEVGIKIESPVVAMEKDFLTKEDKNVILNEGKKLLNFVKNSSYEGFYGGKINESDGVNLKKGSWLVLYKMLDCALLNIINKVFSAEQMEVPNIINISELQKSNYLKGSFHHVNIISHMDRDYEKINRFRKIEITDTIDKEYLSTPTQVLNPAVCLHCYPLFKNRNIKDTTYVTAIGQSYRDESGNLDNDIRLKEFTMREVVYFGNKEKSSEAFDRMLQVMDLFGKSLELNFKLMPSNDIFFDDNIGKKTAFQKALQNKIEIEVYDTVLKKNVAIASANRHGNHFSKPYNIDSNDGSAVTMCLAFGYDRIMKVLIDTHAYNNILDCDK